MVCQSVKENKQLTDWRLTTDDWRELFDRNTPIYVPWSYKSCLESPVFSLHSTHGIIYLFIYFDRRRYSFGLHLQVNCLLRRSTILRRLPGKKIYVLVCFFVSFEKLTITSSSFSSFFFFCLFSSWCASSMHATRWEWSVFPSISTGRISCRANGQLGIEGIGSSLVRFFRHLSYGHLLYCSREQSRLQWRWLYSIQFNSILFIHWEKK